MPTGSGADLGARLRGRDLTAAPATLNLVESRDAGRARRGRRAPARGLPRARSAARRRRTWSASPGRPAPASRRCSASSSRAWRAAGRTVAALAVDPSSRRSGGALLADRARIPYDPARRRRLHPLDRRRRAARRPRPGDPRGRAGARGGLRRRRRRDRRRRAERDRDRRGRRHGRGRRAARLGRRPAVPQERDHGDPRRARRDEGRPRRRRAARAPRPARRAALARRARHGGRRGLEPRAGDAAIDDLVAALDAHRAGSTSRRAASRARRASALADFAAEHGERGLRALGGRRAAERLLADEDPGADVAVADGRARARRGDAQAPE